MTNTMGNGSIFKIVEYSLLRGTVLRPYRHGTSLDFSVVESVLDGNANRRRTLSGFSR